MCNDMTKAGSQQSTRIRPSAEHEGEGRLKQSSFSFVVSSIVGLALASGIGCSVMATRPVQEMSDTSAALRAAQEVQADTLAPELYRQANEWFFKAKHEYKVKNFAEAKTYADKARVFAEQAEFESIRSGANRTDAQIAEPMSSGLSAPPSEPVPTTTPTGYAYPTPTGTPADPTLSAPPGP